MKQGYSLKVEKASYLKGMIKAPPSKSYTIRAVILAGLDGRLKVFNPLYSDDTLAAIKALEAFGASIKKGNGFLDIKGFRGRPSLKKAGINVGESATLLRLVLPIAVLGKGRVLIKGKGTLLNRPNKAIAQALLSSGGEIKGRDREFRLPLEIEGKGRFQGGVIEVSAGMSSQTVSSLLNIAVFAKQDTTIIVKDEAVSKPYIDITLEMLKAAGINIEQKGYKKFFVSARQRFKPKKDFVIHGDYSSAAFLIAAGCLISSDIVITDLVKDAQGDRRIISILNSMGARIRHINDKVIIKGPFALKGRDIDCRDTPDLVPVLSAVACFARGKTRLLNIGHLAYKESNRISAVANELRKLNARISAGLDSLLIKQSILKPAAVSSCCDHRIAMALAVAGLAAGGVTITAPECINKSYPHFIADMQSLGVKIHNLKVPARDLKKSCPISNLIVY